MKHFSVHTIAKLALAAAVVLSFGASALAQTDPLPSWNEGSAKRAIVRFVGAFTQALYDEARKNGWTVISMKNDWRRIFSFE